MTSTAQGIKAPVRSERIVDFSIENLKAPFFLRCAALFIDYMALLAVPLGWLLWERSFGDAGVNAAIGGTVWSIGIIFWLLNFLVLPLLRGQTLGKMLTGLTIVKIDGSYVGLGGIIRRHIFGYLATALTLGIGFLISAVNNSGRSLHDLIAGTIVIRGQKRQL